MIPEIKTAETILDFLHVRPARKSMESPRRFAVYSKTEKSPLQQALAKINCKDKRDEAIKIAKQYIDGTDYLSSPPSEIVKATQTLCVDPKQNIADLDHILGKSLRKWLSDEETQKVRTRLWDSFFAQALMPSHKPNDRDGIHLGIRCFHFLETAVNNPDLWPLESWELMQKVRLLVPPDLIPAAPRQGDTKTQQEISDTNKKLSDVVSEVQKLVQSADDLRQLDTVLYRANMVAPKLETSQDLVAKYISAWVSPAKPWTYDQNGDPESRLQSATKALLLARKTEFQNSDPREAANALFSEAYIAALKFLRSLSPGAFAVITRSSDFQNLTTLMPLASAPSIPYPTSPAVETAESRGIRPLGLGDLLVVKQLLWKYQPGELAHIENVLAREYRSRKHSRTQETEETVFSESERVEQTERDTQSSDRFELKREVQQTLDERMKTDSSVSVTASYGAVTFSADADFASERSSSEASKTASNFAREITERAVSKLSQRTREERQRRTLDRIEEKNEHTFDNKDSGKNIVGLYRWVDKFYKARIINRGKRLMMEFMVPEPAAFYLHTLSHPYSDPGKPQRPEQPMFAGQPLRADHLTSDNYMEFAAKYSARDVAAFPDEFRYISAVVAEKTSDGLNHAIAKTSTDLLVPDGYIAHSFDGWRYNCHSTFGTPGVPRINVMLAGAPIESANPFGLRDVIPISILAIGYAFDFAVRVRCVITDKVRSVWQLNTYQAIIEGYQRQLDAWSDQVGVRENQGGVDIAGRNPDLNRKIERDELRKASLRILNNEYASTKVGSDWRICERFNAIVEPGFNGYPELNPSEALIEGKIIQFFEQAFEWNNLTYRYLPYFWGRKENWLKKYALSDPDPMFMDFLRAGAARVVVPVHPEYTEVVLHYLHTNEIWNGGEPPMLEDPLYISIVDEIKSENDADLANAPMCSIDDPQFPCIVEEFEIKLPTTLVWLQQDDKLPHLDLDALPQPNVPVVPPADLAKVLDARAKAFGVDTDWRQSVVDLMKLLGLQSSLKYRRRLAQKLGCPVDKLNGDSTGMNLWLHSKLLMIAHDNNGEIPNQILVVT